MYINKYQIKHIFKYEICLTSFNLHAHSAINVSFKAIIKCRQNYEKYYLLFESDLYEQILILLYQQKMKTFIIIFTVKTMNF